MRRPRAEAPELGERKSLDLGELYDEHADLVARWAWRLGGPRTDIEDIVQEVFLVVQRRLSDYRPPTPFRSWLYGITTRVIADRRKRERRRWWILEKRPEQAYETPRSGPTPLDQLERKRALELIYRVLDRMRENNRTVFIFAELDGMSADEIAQLTGIRVETVWVRLHRARKQFADIARSLLGAEDWTS